MEINREEFCKDYSEFGREYCQRKYALSSWKLWKAKRKFGVEVSRSCWRRKLALSREYSRVNLEALENDYFKGYFLGIIASDGYVRKGHVGLRIEVTDLDILEFIKVSLSLRGEIHPRKEKGSWWLTIPGTSIYELCINHGIVNKKSKILCPIIHGSEEFERGFVSGYFDGDGTLVFISRSVNFSYAFCSGSEASLTVIRGIIKKWCGVELDINEFEGNFKLIGYEDKWSVLRWVYKSGFHMKRKLDRFNETLVLKPIKLGDY